MTALTSPFTVFRDTKSELSENPVWTPGGDVLWIDITAQRVTRSPFAGDLNGGDDQSFSVPHEIGALALHSAGGYVLGLTDGVYLVDEDGRNLRRIAEITHLSDRGRLNDGKIDPYGNFVVGSLNLSSHEPTAALYRITTEGSISVIRDGLIVSNGLDWSVDGTRIYFTDTVAGTVFTAEYSESGEIRNEQVFASGIGSWPDGLTVDSEDHVWVAYPRPESRIVRYAPSGEVVEVIDGPSDLTTSVEFAGPNLSTLIVTTTRFRGYGLALAPGDTGAGALYSAETSVTGKRPNRFGERRRQTSL